MIIYRITNTTTGKTYIGQTVNTLEERWRLHLVSNSQCQYLKQAISKYGKESFKIEMIDWATNQTELNYKEWLWIHKENTLAPNGYNLREGGGSSGRWSDAVKAKMSQAHMGKKFSDEARKKMGLAKKGVSPINKGTVLNSEERKMCGIQNCKQILCINNNITYNSITEAAEMLKLQISSISQVVNKKRNSVYGYKFTYVGK